MSILVWLALGLIAGWIAGILVGATTYGLVGTMVVGIVGAMLGGWLGSIWLGIDVTGFDYTSIALSVAGAIIVLLVLRAVIGRKR